MPGTGLVSVSPQQDKNVKLDAPDGQDTWKLLDYRVQSTWDETTQPLPLSPTARVLKSSFFGGGPVAAVD